MDRILVGLLGIPLGVLIIIYRYQIKQFTGDMDFAEKYLGYGGTYTFLILLGILVSVFATMYAFGTLQELMQSTLGRFF